MTSNSTVTVITHIHNTTQHKTHTHTHTHTHTCAFVCVYLSICVLQPTNVVALTVRPKPAPRAPCTKNDLSDPKPHPVVVRDIIHN